jgi:hypothetical protein
MHLVILVPETAGGKIQLDCLCPVDRANNLVKMHMITWESGIFI